MKKRIFPVTSVLAAFLSTAVSAEKTEKKKGCNLFHPVEVSLLPVNQNVYGLSSGLFNKLECNMTGLAFGLAGNETSKDVNGIAIAVYGLAMAEGNVNGVIFSLFNQVKKDVNGIAFGLFANAANQDMNGIFSADF